MAIQIPQQAIDLITRFEGCRLKAYRDDGYGIITIGYGHTKNVNLGDIITESQALEFLQQDLQVAARAIARLITVKLTDNQLSALLSFTFNLGSGALQRSTLRMKLNRGEYKDAADEFLKWASAGGKQLKGLMLRRQAERNLFLKATQ